MRLDVPTLVFFAGLTCLAQIAALAIQFRINRVYRGIDWWLGGAAAFAAGFFFLVLSAQPRVRWLGLFGNPALMFAHMGLMIGTLRFLDRPERRPWAMGVLGGAVIVYNGFMFLVPSISARTVVVATTIALFDLVTTCGLLAHRDRRFAQSARFTAAIFLAHSCFLLALAGITLAHAPLRSYQDYSFFQTLAFVVPAIASILWTFGFILMLNQRLGADRLESLGEWRRAEREKTSLAIRNRQLQKAESLTRMAGAIAHHYNNHLQAVLGNLELLEAAPSGPDTGRLLANGKRAAERAMELARHMLVYLGQPSREQEIQDLSALCRKHLPSIQASLPAQVRFQADLPVPGPSIRANAEQIQLALANLASNAREAMGEPGGELRVGIGTHPAAAIPARNRFPVGWQPRATDHAWLEVADSGVGIAPADLEKLCDPFYSTKFTGRGLGLSVVLGIAQAHGGGVTVESRPGVGSAFRVHIPVAGLEEKDLKGC